MSEFKEKYGLAVITLWSMLIAGAGVYVGHAQNHSETTETTSTVSIDHSPTKFSQKD